MKTSKSQLIAILGAFLLLQGCAGNDQGPRGFGSPKEAADSLAAAIRADNVSELVAIMGSDSEDVINSGDEVADRARRQKFLAQYDKKHGLEYPEPTVATLVVGETDWPFPVPIVFENGKWTFDLESGREEIINRRVGENELSAIQVCKAYADAQREYALRDPQSTGKRAYARQFVSDSGKKNGLFWPVTEGERPSPMGEFAASASAEGYRRKEQGPTPYHGYYYRILEAQGPDAPDGALEYVVDGHMVLGFAIVAYPAEYDSSGVMSFIMSADGVVYQKDLGEQTEKLATEMKAFNPDSSWKRAE